MSLTRARMPEGPTDGRARLDAAAEASGEKGAEKRRIGWRKWLRRALWVTLAGAVAVGAINLWVLASANGRIFQAGDDFPGERVALVLGTSSKAASGRANLHFEARMDAAAELIARGRARTLLVSGDNRSAYYNEPRDMRDALIRRGVPESAIVCDYAGLRTLDSVVRAREVFGVDRCLIVSDRWHLPRAIFIARQAGLEAVGVAGAEVEWRTSLKSHVRECLARVLVVSDLFLTRTRPQHGADGSEPQLSSRGTEEG